MSEEPQEHPLSRKAIENAQTLAALNWEKDEAHKVAEQSKAVVRFDFNEEESKLFELALAKYNLLKRGGENVRFLNNPVNEAIGRIPIINVFNKIADHGQKQDEKVLEMIKEETAPLMEREVEVGRYTSNSIIAAANLISSSWFNFRKDGKNFEEQVEKQTDYITSKVLAKKQE
jgi:hypothetical protein